MVADNVYDLLQRAWQVSKGGDASMFGVEVGIVTNVQDPEKLGRVKVCFPRLPGKPEGDWARIAQPSAGAGRGFYWVPQVNDEVLVAFERGHTNHPFVLGCLWNGVDLPMADAYTGDNTVQMIQTRSGHQIVLSDASGEEKITISDKSGKRVVTFDVKAKKFLIEAKEGDVELRAEKKMVLACETLEIKAAKSAKVNTGTNFDLKVDGKAQIASSSRMDLKGSVVSINPPGGGGGGGGGGAAASAASAAQPAKSAKSGAAKGGGAAATGGGDLASDVAPARSGGAPQKSAAAQPAAAGSAVAEDAVDLQLVSVSGTPQKNVEVELTLADGTRRAGKTDGEGHFKLSGLPKGGKAKLAVPDVSLAPDAPASVAGRVRFVKDATEVPIGKASVVELPPRVRRGRMRGMHFDTGKTFLLPSAMIGIRQLVKLFKSFEGIVGLVTGHTDRQGRDGVDASRDPPAVEFNRALSNERADVIKAFLLDDADAWMRFYGQSTHSRPWGVLEDQHMLGTVKPKGGDTPFLSPPQPDGLLGPNTTAAYKEFQHSRLLPETGKPDRETRLELVRAYMALDGTSLDAKAPVATHGCGLTHPTPETEGDPALTPAERAKAKPDQPVNRRVEVFLFEEKIEPAPRTPCPSSGCVEYQKWVDQQILDVDLDQPPGNAVVKVTDAGGAPLASAHVHLAGPLALDGDTGADGVARFDELVPGDYTAIANADGLLAADAVLQVPSGGEGTVTLALATEGSDLEVLVVDEEKPPKAVEGAQVAIALDGVAAQTTDKDGKARFAKLPSGTHHLTVTRQGFLKGEADVDVGKAAQPAKAQALRGDTTATVGDAPAQKKPPAQKTVVLSTRTLTVKLAMLFVAKDKPAEPRWAGTHPVDGATLELVDPIGAAATVKSQAKGNGVYILNVSSFERGPFDLKVSPAEKKVSAGPAGVATATGKADDPDFMWRPFTATLTLGDGGVKDASIQGPPPPAPPARPPPPFVVVSQVKPLEVTFDWRPDWMKRVKTDQTIGGMKFGRTPTNGQERIDVLVLHQTAGRISGDIEALVLGQGSLVDAKDDQGRVIVDPATGQPKKKKIFAVGIHYLIDADGHAIKVVHEKNEAVHAEPGHWLDSVDVLLNGRSVGIEIVHRDGDAADPKKMSLFSDGQYDSILRIVREIQGQFPLITRQRVAGHCDVDLANERFGDPGILFEWNRLEAAGLSRKAVDAKVTKPYGIEPGKTIDKKAAEQVKLLQKDLKTIGYRMNDTPGVFGNDTAGAVRRFKRHWFSFRGGDKDTFAFPDENVVDFATAERIVQVVSDGDTPAQPGVAQITSLTVAPASGGGAAPVKAGESAGADPAGAVVVQEGEQVRVSWSITGSAEGLRLDPGGHDVAGVTKDGKGSIDVVIRRQDAPDGFIDFRLTLASAAPVKSAVASPGADQQPAPGTSLSQQAVIAHKIPALPADPITGTKFLDLVKGLDADASLSKLPAREKVAVETLVAGNVPTFLRTFVPIDLAFKGPSGTAHTGQVYVSPDFLAIGTDADFIRWPMTPIGAQQVVDAFGCTFVTTKVSDAIFNAKGCKQLTMHSHTEWVKDPDPAKTFGFLMRANAQYAEINKRIDADLGKAGTLAAGHKKDVILHKFVAAPDKPSKGRHPVIIYGCKFQGKFPFQDPFPGHHADDYEDYSHGIRLLSQQMLVDGKPKPVFEVLRDPELFGLLLAPSIFEDSEKTRDPNYPLRYPGQAAKPGQKLTMQIIDADGKPRPGVPYKLTVGTVVSEKKTDASGAIDEPIASVTGKGTLEIDGHVIELEIGDLAPVTELAGVQARLNNLGFIAGAPSGELNQQTREALLRFQATHRLERTGTVTAQTQAKLKEVYEG